MEKNQLLKLIYEEIDFVEGEIKEDEIIWKDIFGGENSVSKFNSVFRNNQYAWYETNEVGNDKLKIKINPNFILEWKVPVNSMGSSYRGCRFIDFCHNFLILVYTDKHRDQLVFINTETFTLDKIRLDVERFRVELKSDELLIKDFLSGIYRYLIKIGDGNFTKEVITS